jgi:hypothetical protein
MTRGLRCGLSLSTKKRAHEGRKCAEAAGITTAVAGLAAIASQIRMSVEAVTPSPDFPGASKGSAIKGWGVLVWNQDFMDVSLCSQAKTPDPFDSPHLACPGCGVGTTGRKRWRTEVGTHKVL